MTEQYVPNLGHAPEDGARRDAVHIAVAPVVAGELLLSGQHVWVGRNRNAYLRGDETESAIGIVDPFRADPVLPGGRFWIFLYPGTITGLRHLWSHPVFDLSGEKHP